MSTSRSIEVVEATDAEWDRLVDLFGRAGADNGCWCQYWVIGAEYHRRDRSGNKSDLRDQVDEQRAGLLALRDGEPVGWARLTRRSNLGHLTRRFSGFEFSDDDPLALACFFIHRRLRGEGIMTALISGARDRGREIGVAVEAYPVDPSAPGATKNRFSGVHPAFLQAGFVEVGRLASDRAVVRSG